MSLGFLLEVFAVMQSLARPQNTLSPSLERLILPALLGVSLLACGGAGSPSGSGGAGGAGADPVLSGTWQHVFSGTDHDYPNAQPWVDAVGGQAHFVYVAKAGNLRYFLFGDGDPQEVPLPQGTKGFGRVMALSSGDSVVITTETFNGTLGALHHDGAAVTPLDPPLGGQSVALLDLAATAAGSSAFVAVGAAAGGVAVGRMEIGPSGAPSAWSLDTQIPGDGQSVARVVLASDGTGVALAFLTGTSTRGIHARRGGVWEDLGAPPDAGTIALPWLAIDGQDVYYLEWEEGPQQSVLWRHDGSTWREHARSDQGECFHALTMHEGALYTLTSDSPNGVTLTTRGFARLEEGKVLRRGFLSPTGDNAIDPGSRIDVADYRESYLVSRDGRLYLAYQEMGTPSIIHLYRHAPAP